MTLPDDYLTYPQRKRGQDHDRYGWQAAGNHAPATLSNGAVLGVSIIIPLEFFMLNPSGKPFKHPGAMVTPYPDLRHYTTRDYGNRVGVFRLLRALSESRVKATFAINAALIERARPLIDAIIEAGHEIAAHGYDTDSIHWEGAAQGEEERYINQTRAAFEKINLNPRAWMSPARQQSFRTLDLIRAADFDICLDWEPDVVPIAMNTKHGEVRAFPVLNELDDRFILQTKHHSEEEWRIQITEAASMMKAEASNQGAQVFGFTMTPYIAAQPFRMHETRQIIEQLSADDGICMTTVSELTDYFTD